jgi:hypothetical protein
VEYNKRTRVVVRSRRMKTIRVVEDGVVLYDVFDELETLKKRNTELQIKLDATARAVEPVLWEILKEIEEEDAQSRTDKR